MVPQHSIFNKNERQPLEGRLLFSGIENRIEKSCFYKYLWLFEDSTEIFNHKETDVSKSRGYWELISIFFQKLSWCTTTAPNVLFLPYLYPEIWTVGKKDPQA